MHRAVRRHAVTPRPLVVMTTLVCLLLVSAVGAASEVEVLDVAPLAVACAVGDTQPRCLLVRSAEGGAWRVAGAAIDDFEPLPGYGYRLLVAVDAPGARTLRAVLEAVPLGDVRWRVEALEVGGEVGEVAATTHAWLRLDASGARIHGNAGCNAFFGTAEPLERGRLSLGPLAGTLMACPEPLMRAERALLSVLEGVVAFEQDGTALRLSGPGGVAWLRPELPRDATASVRRWGDAALERFDATVAAAAADGAGWAFDPLLVALALAEPWDVATLDVARRDVEPEDARTSVVSVEASGFLDDSLAGFRRVVVLERREGGRWRVVAETDAVRCARGDALWIAANELCP